MTWGVNEAGQLGYGKMEIQETPTTVGGQIEDQFIVKVTCSSLATLVLTKEGNLYAWGFNESGALSIGNSLTPVYYPQRVLYM